jgi:hypothetical protein
MNALEPTANRLLASALAGAVLFTLIGAGSAGAQIRLQVPDDSPGPPIYARVERPFVYHTAEWAAIVFYRSPDCVPGGFNLLDLFDLGAFDCPLTVSGFELWGNEPGIDAAPRLEVTSGDSVPVWFVPWPDLQAAIADDVLTLSELDSLSPLKGVATFREVLSPFVGPGETGGAQVTHLAITAAGVLSDGRSFQYEYTDAFADPEKGHVRIVLR